MQDESTPIQKKNEQAISVRTKRLLERLEELWQCSDELTFEAVRRILVDLPEEDQAVGIEALADHLFNLMKLHFLDIVATFHKKAKEEGISAEERDEIAHDIRQESFQIMQSLEKQLAIRSVDDLVMLGNITFGLYSMSLVESAEQAERWMYKLPKMYRDRLEHEHLVLEPPQVTVIVSATSTKPTTSWNVVLSQPSIAWTGNYQPQQIVPVSSWVSKQSSLVA